MYILSVKLFSAAIHVFSRSEALQKLGLVVFLNILCPTKRVSTQVVGYSLVYFEVTFISTWIVISTDTQSKVHVERKL